MAMKPLERNADAPRTFVLAGGGSGGHISPGLAIAEQIAALDPHATLVFVCSERPIDAHMLDSAGADYVRIPARSPSLSPVGALRFVRAFRQSRRAVDRLLRERAVERVIALGGFVSAPPVAAAHACGVPVTLINLDNPPGRANRWLARHSTETWSAVALPTRPRFAERVVGMPIRRCARAASAQDRCREQLGLAPDVLTLFVTGASQGASSLNELMITLVQTKPTMFDGWQIYHLAGHGAEPKLRQAYEHSGIRFQVQPFLDEIGLAWGAADLALSRAGANSVAEVAANAVPTLFVPYPHHRDEHQWNNAQPLVTLGGARIVREQPDRARTEAALGARLESLMGEGPERATMRERLRAEVPPDAAESIARELLAMRSGPPGTALGGRR